MDKAAFTDYLRGKGLDEEAAQKQLIIAEHLDLLLSARKDCNLRSCGAKAARTLIDSLAQSGEDSIGNIYAILRYGSFFHNDGVYEEAFKALDGIEALDGVYRRLEEVLGSEERDRIFSLIGPISPGTDFPDRAKAMKTVMQESLRLMDAKQKDRFFRASFRDLDDRHYKKDAELYRARGGIDGYLEASREGFLGELRSCMEEGRPFFGQPVTEEVIELVGLDPEMAAGRREGNSVYVTKIPFRAKDWLEEKDPVKRRHLYCHCPWARESILSEAGPVPSEFCRCSAGFHRKPWEAIFGDGVSCTVLESALAGDDRCRFRIDLPHVS